MQNKEALTLYKKRQIESATPSQLVLMLYDALIDQLNKAASVFEEVTTPQNIEKYHNLLIMCQHILTELMLSLDLENGGEIAHNLLRLYEYMHRRLVTANIKRAPQAIQEVKKLIMDIRTSWQSALEREQKNIKITKDENASLPSDLNTPSSLPKLNITG